MLSLILISQLRVQLTVTITAPAVASGLTTAGLLAAAVQRVRRV